MKRYIFMVLIGVMSVSTNASEGYDSDFCRTVGKFSKVVMEKRQEQYPKQSMEEIVSANTPKNIVEVKQQKVMEMVVKEAYDVPVFNTMEKQQHATRVFSNRMNASCLESVGK